MIRSKVFTAIFFSFFIFHPGIGQISYGGNPSPFDDYTQTVVLPPIPAQTKAELQEAADRVIPFKFAYRFKVNYSCDRDGEWFGLPDGGRLWRMRIKSEGALSLYVVFDKFKLPEGGKVFIYDPDRSTVLGSFTSKNNKPDGILAVSPVSGDEIIIEYSDDGTVSGEPLLEIGTVYHDYVGIFGYLSNNNIKSGWFGDSGSCNVNVNCSDFTPDSIQRSVCKIIIDGMLCSGSLVNNTRNDGTPYFLTAAHCLTSANSDRSIIFYFNYETPKCISFVEGPKSQTLSGSTRKAQVDTLDFALVEIDNMPPATYRPYWAGWNLSTSPPPPFVIIHHPQGDVKKISLDEDAITGVTFNASSVDGDPFVKDGHWLVSTWEYGTTEGGSSGAGLFDTNARLVGTLSGGEASCGNSVNDDFARLNKYWNYLPGNDQQVAHWLDPDNTGVSELNGLDYYKNRTQIISHLSKEDTVVLIKNSDGISGYWTGHNSLGITEYAELYPNIKTASVNGIYLVFGEQQIGGGDTVNLKLWSGSYSGPDVLLADTALAVSLLSKNREHLISFNKPVNINGPFFAGIEIKYGTSETDTVALYQISNSTANPDAEYGYLYYQDSWKKLSEVNTSGVKGNFWIDVLASDVTYSPVNDIVHNAEDLIIYPNPVYDGKLYYKTGDPGLHSVEVYNLNGQKVITQNVRQGITNGIVNLHGLTSGVYLVRFIFRDRTVSRKIVVSQVS